MKRLLLMALMLTPSIIFGRTTEATHTLTSPDQRYEFTFYHDKLNDTQKELCYSITFNGETIIEKSRLGVLIENQLFESALGVPNEHVEFWCENLNLLDVKLTSPEEEVWQPIYGERAEVKSAYNQMQLIFQKGEQQGKDEYNKFKSYYMDVEVRAYNEGVAFRYHFPEALNGLFIHIVGEQTSFKLPEGTLAYYEGWAQGHYEVRELKDWGDDESERPLTLKLPNGKLITLAEAKMTNYVPKHLF